MLKKVCVFVACLVVSASAWAQEVKLSPEEIKTLLVDKIKAVEALGKHPLIVADVKAQNEKKVPMEEITKLDKEWQATKEMTPFKQSLQENKSGKFLKTTVEKNQAIYNEAFVTDNQGANVAAFPATSDYWQGDEEKFTASFNSGQGKTFIGKAEHDQSTNTIAAQVSVPVLDGDQTIGVLIMGLKLSYAEAQKAKAAQ